MNHLEFDGFQFDVEVKLCAEVEDLRLIWKLHDFTYGAINVICLQKVSIPVISTLSH